VLSGSIRTIDWPSCWSRWWTWPFGPREQPPDPGLPGMACTVIGPGPLGQTRRAGMTPAAGKPTMMWRPGARTRSGDRSWNNRDVAREAPRAGLARWLGRRPGSGRGRRPLPPGLPTRSIGPSVSAPLPGSGPAIAGRLGQRQGRARVGATLVAGNAAVRLRAAAGSTSGAQDFGTSPGALASAGGRLARRRFALLLVGVSAAWAEHGRPTGRESPTSGPVSLKRGCHRPIGAEVPYS
jgi:hypothetical protein